MEDINAWTNRMIAKAEELFYSDDKYAAKSIYEGIISAQRSAFDLQRHMYETDAACMRFESEKKST